MRKIFLLFAGLLLAAAGYAQGETPFFSEDFEGDTHQLTLVNEGQTNQWYVGTATANGGSKSAYISDNGGITNSYNSNATSVVHMYADVTFPATEKPYYRLSFDWKGVGEYNYDDLKVYVMETSVTPMVGDDYNLGTPIGTYNLQGDSWLQNVVYLPQAYGGTIKRLVFTWRNDGSGGYTPPAAVDNIALTATATAPPRASGSAGSLSWTLDYSGTLTISGTGSMADYYYSAAPWEQYNSYITAVVVEDGVTSVGAGAFRNLYQLSSLSLGSNVETIGSNAFYYCENLSTVNLPEGLEIIGSGAFYSTGLQTLSLPESLTAIGEEAFAYCRQLRSVESLGSVETIGSGAFRDCLSLQTVTLNKELTSLGLNAFSGCNNLAAINVEEGNATYSSVDGVLHKGKVLVFCPPAKTGDYAIGSGIEVVDSMAFIGCSRIGSVSFPASVTEIRYGAFAMCDGLISVNLGSGITAIGEAAFTGCTKLKAINVDGGNTLYTSIDGVLFNKAKTTLLQYPAGRTDAGYTIPAGVKAVGAYAFMGNSALGAVYFPAGLETIGESAFSNTGLRSVSLLAGLKSIGAYAFENCYSLSSVAFPTGLETIGNSAFSYCSALTTVAIPEGVKTIGSSAFYRCSALTTVAIPEGVKTIGEYAFYNCSNLAAVVLSADTVGASAFESCSQLNSLTLLEGVKRVGEYAFYGNSLSSLTLPASLTAVGYNAFYNWDYYSALEQVISLNLQPPTVGSSIFYDNSNLRIEVPAAAVASYKEAWSQYEPYIVAIGAPRTWDCGSAYTDTVVATLSRDTLYVNGTGEMASFYSAPWNKYRDSIRTVVVGSGVTNVSSNAFANHSNLRSVILGDDVASIGGYAFEGCSKLSSVAFGSGLTDIFYNAFAGCVTLTSVNLPPSLIYIENGAFSGCTSLTAINVAEGNLNYASMDGVLFNADSTTLMLYPAGRAGAYAVPEGVTYIGNDAFSYCTGLTELNFPTSLSIVGYSAFSGCTGLTELILPEGMSGIYDGAFSQCSNLRSVALPSSLTYIGYNAFYGCTALAEVVNLNPTPVNIYSSQDIFFGVNTAACTLKVRQEAVADYEAAEVWTDFVIESLVFYTVSFEDNGADVVIAPINEQLAGSKIAQPAEPTKVGYTFGGWYKDNGFTQVWNFAVDVVTESIMLYAKWISNSTPSFLVTLDLQDGSAPMPYVLVEENATVAEPAALARRGFVFDGWYKNSECTTAWNFATDKVTAATTLYAKWTVATFTVAFDAKGGSKVDSMKNVPYNSTISMPAMPTRYGYSFYGWSKSNPDMGGVNYWNFGTDKVTADITLYALWSTAWYDVYFDYIGSVPVEHGDTVPKPSVDPTRYGYDFAGWYKDEGCNTAWVFSTDTITANNTVIYAKWEAKDYIVRFNTQGGSKLDSIVASYGSTITEPATDPTKAGFRFLGWYEDSECKYAWDFANYEVQGNTMLYAKWIDNTATTYTVTFNSQGGSSVSPVADIQSGETVNEPADPTRAGHIFDGWYKDAECTLGWSFDYSTVNSNITLYAKWRAAKYTVVFDPQGGSTVPSLFDVAYGTKISAPTPPTRANYFFDGWHRGSGRAWNFYTDTVVADIWLYANWLSLHTVAFDAMGGTAVDSIKNAPYGKTITEPTPPTKDGYTFAGWYDDYGDEWIFNSRELWYDMTLYAKWVENSEAVDVTSVNLNKTATTLLVGGSEQLTLTINPANATNQSVSWSSSNDAVATVSNGLITALAPGTATITVTTADGGFTATCTVTVSAAVVAVTSVSLNKHSTILLVGGSEQLSAAVTPLSATNQNVWWNSSNSSVASVNNEGMVTAISAGSAIIFVTTEDGNKRDSCTVRVSATAVAVTGVSLNTTALTLAVDSSEQLTATIAPDTATNQNVSWSSSNDAVAVVSGAGLVTAVSAGTATITVTTADGDFTATCTITVNTVTPPNAVAAYTLLSLKIYPNPVVNGQVTIDNEEWGAIASEARQPQAIEIYSLSGALVATYPIVGAQTSINVSQLPSGTYIVKVGRYVGKMVKL